MRKTRPVCAALFAACLCAAPLSAQEKPADVPMSAVVLFTSGIGYFQHDGSVDGNARMDIEFSSSGINDVLKSMILRDLGGGTVSSVTYASQDPITRTLKSFVVDLTANPGISSIMDQLRGRSVEISAPDVVKGTILGVESRVALDADKKEVPVTVINVLTPQGIKSVGLAQVQGIRFTDPGVQTDLETALALIASSKGLDKKMVSVHFTGKGTRRVRVGYVQEAPVWKASYRLAVGDDKTTLLQGWAIVENTTDRDWKNVSLTLVSGQPITFAMDLYSPLYVDRPVVQLEIYQSLRPRTYDMALGSVQPEEAAVALVPQAPAMAKAMAPASSTAAGARAARDEEADMGWAEAAPQKPPVRASAVGELFQYKIDSPVSLPRQQSSLLPIVNQNVTAEKYSIYNVSVDAVHPLNALKLKNTSGFHLMQGPVTVFDGGSYAGDAQIGDFPAGAEQFVSYAIDLDTEVQATDGSSPRDLFNVKISKGVMTTTYKWSREKDYLVKNRGTKARNIIIEHPFDAAWNLTLPKEAMERSRSVYRFLLPVDPGKTKSLAVVEERMVDQTVSASSLNADSINVFVRSSVVSQAVKDALQKLLSLKSKLSDATTQRRNLESQVQTIYTEQQRIRDNIDHVEKGSTLYQRYIKTLNDQEDQLAKLSDAVAKAKADETARQKEVDAFIMAMEVK